MFDFSKKGSNLQRASSTRYVIAINIFFTKIITEELKAFFPFFSSLNMKADDPNSKARRGIALESIVNFC